jgi:hypothetical protein
MNTCKLTTLLLATAMLLLAACGGGSAPAPNFPAAVTEITEDDLLAAGMPALPDEGGVSAVREASADYNADGVVDAADYVTLHNLTTTTTGFVTSVPEDTTTRVIGWVMYRLPGSTGDRTRSLTVTDLVIDPMLRVFAAVSNFSAGRWEPAGPLSVGSANGGVWKLSPGARYNRQNGDSFLLLLIAHPGHGQMSGYNIKLEDILISSVSAPSSADDFAAGVPGAARWEQGRVDYIGPNIHGNYRIRQQFLPPAPAQPQLLFPQPLNLGSADGSDFFAFQRIVGDWNSDGADTVGFFDPSEVNGPRHGYRLSVWDDTDIAHAVNIVPVEQRGGDSVLIGLLIPAPSVSSQVSISVDLSEETPERVADVDVRGRFELANIDELPTGQPLSLNFSKFGLEYSAQLLEEEGIFYFLISPAK